MLLKYFAYFTAIFIPIGFVKSVIDGETNPYMALIIIPAIPLVTAIWKGMFSCIICGLSATDKDFSNPDREMKIKYNMDHFNDDLYSKNLRWKLSFGTNTCAA